ncbi:MAG: hypothetical protein C1942_05240 [Prosthecochloris sp.]|uniref:DUF4347 domain-containing protein n=1 Tax=Prosthecochloris sp. TaxID=290513 RepID=UPI0013C815A6|nr:DUF4347 domain-containing protein [Prosthecochloris sp.]NEX12093.1 hypothetical protein [Prosthecochloris sp.]
MSKTIAFIDSRIEGQDLLISQFGVEVEYVLLDATRDGVQQIAESLSGKNDYDSIQIFSHGTTASIVLGRSYLNAENLASYTSELAMIGQSLNDNGDILLYGCNVGAGVDGTSFIEMLASATGADVAASDDVTGSAAADGDWDLEVRTGEVDEREIVEPEGYSGVLAEPVITGDSGNNSLSGTENDDTIYGYEGNDTLDGGAGNDYLIGGYHADTIIGGTGNDRILFDRDDTSVDGGDGSDALLLERDYDFEEIAAHATNIESVVLTQERHWIDDVNVQDIISLTTGSGGSVLYFRIDDDAPENPEYTIELKDGEGWHDTGTDVTEGTGEFQLTFDVYVDMDNSAAVVVQQGIDVEYDRYDVIGTSGNDVIDGEYGGRTSDNPEIIAGFGGNDTIDAGDGNDFVWAGEGDDSVNGDEGDDLLWAGGGHDTINGNEGNDFIGAASGTLTATGGAGADVFGLLEPDSGFDLRALPVITVTDFTIAEDRVFFSQLVEYAAQGYTGGNPMHPDLGYIVLEQNGNDTLIRFDADGATGSETAETIMILQNVTAASLTSSNFLNAFTTIEDDDIPTSVSYSTTGIDPNPTDTVVGGATDLIGTDGYNFFWGGFGNDSFSGGAGSDNLEGKYGDDTLDGGDGDDELNGGPGNDSLVGGTGNDSYEIPLDGTHDVIRDTGGNEDRIDIEIDGNQAMWFGDAIYENGDILFTAVSSYQDAPDNLIITQLTVEDVESGGLVERIDIEFEDNCACLRVSTGPTGSDDQHDLIVAVQSGTTIEGLDRDDYLFGSVGSDTLEGGNGNDFLNGHDGADQLVGGQGSDTLVFDPQDTLIDGNAEGLSDLYSNDKLIVIDESKDLTYSFFTIAANSRNIEQLSLELGGNHSITGITVGDVIQMTEDNGAGERLLIITGDSGDAVSFDDGNDGNVWTSQVSSLNGRTYNVFTHSSDPNVQVAVEQDVQISSGSGNEDECDTVLTDGNDIYSVTETEGEIVCAGDGDDSVHGGTGDDMLIGGAGNDTLHGNAGDDWLLAGPGDDSVDGGVGDDLIGNTSGSVVATGGEGRDAFGPFGDDDGLQDDYAGFTVTDFQTGASGDILVFIDLMHQSHEAGYYDGGNPFGSYIILENDVVGEATDTIVKFDLDGSGTNHAPEEIMRLQGVDKNTIQADNIFNGVVSSRATHIESVLHFNTGIDPEGTDPVASFTYTATSAEGLYIVGGLGNDSLTGGTGDDDIMASFGNDTLHGGDGNDELDGSGGDDHLYGEGGNDEIDGGTGVDTVYFTGNVEEYTYSFDVSTNTWTITDTVDGRDGTDEITDVEIYVFADHTEHFPFIVSLDPADAESEVALDSTIVITFSEEMVFENGTISIHEGAVNGPVFESYNVTSPGNNLVLNGAELTIDPTENFAPDSTYYVNISYGALEDRQDNSFLQTTEYSFHVDSDESSGGIISLLPGFSGDVWFEFIENLSDTRILVALETYDIDTYQDDIVVDVFNADGTDDQGFSDNYAADSISHFFEVNGKALVIGHKDGDTSGSNIILERHTADGLPDTSFGENGTGIQYADFGLWDSVNDAALQADGKILVAAQYSNVDSSGSHILRYTADGSLDTSFSGDGVLEIAYANLDWLAEVLPQSDNRIVVMADLEDAEENWSLLMTRYDTDGSLDTSYGTSGSFETDFGGTSRIDDETVLMLNDNKVLIVGEVEETGSTNDDILLARFSANGGLDSSYAEGTGFEIINMGGDEQVDAVSVTSDGKILVAGSKTVNIPEHNSDLFLFRLNADGTWDDTFYWGDTIIQDLGGDEEVDAVIDMPDGGILVAGTTGSETDPDIDDDVFLVLYNADGTINTGFAENGILTTGTHGHDMVSDIVVQADGKIVIGASSTDIATGETSSILGDLYLFLNDTSSIKIIT